MKRSTPPLAVLGAADLPWVAALLAAFVASRRMAVAAGVNFNGSPLFRSVQIPPPDLIEHRLAETLLYLHAQPPGFAALVGGVLKAATGPPDLAFLQTYRAFGLVLSLSLYVVFRAVGAARPLACIGAALFVVSPEAILYENWLAYSYPVAALLVAACAALAWFIQTRRPVAGLIAFSCAALVVVTRATYHFVWLLVPLALCLGSPRMRWRTVLLAAAGPVLIASAIYLKNLVLFGQLASSSWLGMNLARASTAHVPLSLRSRSIDEGAVSTMAYVPPFSDLDAYPIESQDREVYCRADVPILTRETKGSRPNFNHCAYIGISAVYRRDALALIRRFPGYYLKSMAISWAIFAQPVTENGLVRGRDRIGRYANWFEKWILLQPVRWTDSPTGTDWSLFNGEGPRAAAYRSSHATLGLLAFAAAGIVGYGGSALIRFARRCSNARDVALLFTAATCIFSAVVSNALERGENNRFRMEIEPLLFVMATLAAAKLARIALAACAALVSGLRAYRKRLTVD